MNLDLRELLPENNKKMMENYINLYSNSNTDCKNIDDVLREWAASKRTLYHTLGDKFIVEFPIEYSRPISDISDDCWKETAYPSKFSTFLHDLMSEFKCTTSYTNNIFNHIIVNADNMATNTINIETPISVQHKLTQKTIVIQPGAKYFRTLHHLVKECGGKYDNIFEEFRIRISQITNQRSLKGTMCISIHPMDFITMSDNGYGWDSCMRWIDGDGDYRMGTVEMMNSPIVVCAYLKGSEPFNFGWNKNDEFTTWNNKKWRELFIVTPELITEIKSYPYDNEEFTKAVMDTLLALSKENNDNEYDTEVYWTYATSMNSRGMRLQFGTYENGMYNDFGCYRNNKGHLMHYNSQIMENITDCNNYCITYSGAKTCMICGAYIDDYDADPKEVVCEKHGYYTHGTCGCCGRRLVSDNIFYSDWTGQEYCEECYYDNFIVDDIIDEDIPVSSAVEFFLIDSSLLSDEEGVEEWHKKVSAYTSTVETMTDEFGIAPYHLSSKYYDYYCYTFEQVAQNPKIANFFGFVLDDVNSKHVAASHPDYSWRGGCNQPPEIYNFEKQIAIYKEHGYPNWTINTNYSAI